MTPPVSAVLHGRHTPGFSFLGLAMSSPPRALVFIDGNNWFHSLEDTGIEHRLDLDYEKISRKILSARTWLGTRYYIGVVPQEYSRELYEGQRRFLSRLENTSPLITIHRGRLERRKPTNKASVEMRQYVSGIKDRLPLDVWNELMDFAIRCNEAEVLVEKAVDVELAIDMVTMALSDTYNHAYLLSADGDFTPAVEAVRAQGKKVYAASAEMSHALMRAADKFFHLPSTWFSDCYRDPPPTSRRGHDSSGSSRNRAASTATSLVPVVVRKNRRRPITPE